MADAEERVRVVLGTMEFGRRCDEEVSNKIVQIFKRRGHRELDTAYMYTGGTSETWIGKMNLNEKMIVATKANPFGKNRLTKGAVKTQLGVSLKRLQSGCADIFYLHAPDHKTDINETLEAVNELHKAGKFKEFALSNYAAWQVVEIYYICKEKGYILPTLYQGMYNPFTRAVEGELFPALRRFGIRFYAYNPLAGGILSGKHSYSDEENNSIQSGRFAGNSWAGKYRQRFWKKSYFDAIDLVKKSLADAYGENAPSLVEASLRFMVHHMKLEGKYGDGVILGCGSLGHFEENVAALDQGEPLHESVVAAFEEGAKLTAKDCPGYYR